MVKNLTRMHGGRVEARSAGLGQGSEFIVRLPVLADQTPARVMKQEEAPHAGSSRRILVVDDVADATASMAELLEILGNEVRTANDGPTALGVARDFHPDLVLLDIGMPGMDGYEVARHLRSEHEDNMVLVALTGYAQESDREYAIEAGFNHHLSKPVAPQELRKLLARTIVESTGP